MLTRTAILDRVISEQKDLPPNVVEFLVGLKLPEDAHLRFEALSYKSEEGLLSEDEKIELDDLPTANDVLMILHSKARAALGRHTPAA